MNRLFLAAAFLVPFAVACSASSSSSEGAEDNLSAAPGEQGGMCAGFAGIQCKEGLRCNVTATHPDAAGRCEAPAPGEEGGMCAGFAGIRCKAGLACNLTAHHPDAAGTCERALVHCMAMPACEEGDSAVAACAPNDPSCYSRSMCGREILCQKSEVTVEGKLLAVAGIGGESTGRAIASSQGMLELVLTAPQSSSFVSGRFARATGKTTTLSGVETTDRPALVVKDLLVCPAPNTSINCMPPVAPGNTLCGADRGWVSAKCEGVSYLD